MSTPHMSMRLTMSRGGVWGSEFEKRARVVGGSVAASSNGPAAEELADHFLQRSGKGWDDDECAMRVLRRGLIEWAFQTPHAEALDDAPLT